MKRRDDVGPRVEARQYLGEGVNMMTVKTDGRRLEMKTKWRREEIFGEINGEAMHPAINVNGGVVKGEMSAEEAAWRNGVCQAHMK